MGNDFNLEKAPPQGTCWKTLDIELQATLS